MKACSSDRRLSSTILVMQITEKWQWFLATLSPHIFLELLLFNLFDDSLQVLHSLVICFLGTSLTFNRVTRYDLKGLSQLTLMLPLIAIKVRLWLA